MHFVYLLRFSRIANVKTKFVFNFVYRNYYLTIQTLQNIIPKNPKDETKVYETKK